MLKLVKIILASLVLLCGLAAATVYFYLNPFYFDTVAGWLNRDPGTQQQETTPGSPGSYPPDISPEGAGQPGEGGTGGAGAGEGRESPGNTSGSRHSPGNTPGSGYSPGNSGPRGSGGADITVKDIEREYRDQKARQKKQLIRKGMEYAGL